MTGPGDNRRAAMLQALDGILDPCSVAARSPVGMTSMGLVRGLAISTEPGGDRVTVTLGLTSPGCMMGALFAAKVEETLMAFADVATVSVVFDHGHIWRPEDASLAYQQSRAARLRELNREVAALAAAPSGVREFKDVHS